MHIVRYCERIVVSTFSIHFTGVRNYCGIDFPDGLKKNQKLEKNVVTPTTKADYGDAPMSPADLVSKDYISQKDYDFCAEKALAVFALGQQECTKRGLILVDTKYEFGKTADGEILLIDEVHTPDSSRFWAASTYAERVAAGQEPESFDKEFLRLWFKAHCDPYKDEKLPEAPRELVEELSWRYICIYEILTGEEFKFPKPHDRIVANAIAAKAAALAAGK